MTHIQTKGIEILVSNWFREDLSNESDSNYFYNYEITIRNRLSYSVQLLSREWHVVHLLHGVSTVTGEGVVGEKPILMPGEEFTYVSGCELINSMGKMYGKFFFKDLTSKKIFYADIPSFNLIFPALLN
ncbi:MAG: Co2+/Mg2+ efflux protein ApaG [Cryomorphaceae bacterium]|nr:Co2+/Mg2+ efflux protein ApaG [Cryomorphaceae bacterium]|tara:strand:- start:14485 stop:14871 length:387 start_codon:yes stop_codon:yes gene_type:complete